MDIREAFLKAKEPLAEQVAIPELGNLVVWVEGLKSGEREELSNQCVTRKNGKMRFDAGKFNRLLIIRSTRKSKGGESVFQESDLVALADVRADVLDRLSTVATRLNRLGQDDDEEAVSPNPSMANGDSSSA